MARGYQARGFTPRAWNWMIFPFARAGRALGQANRRGHLEQTHWTLYLHHMSCMCKAKGPR